LIRAKLNEKEKELLELQRSNSCLTVPDGEQIDKIVDLISSLALTTQDGSFSFHSKFTDNSSTRVHSTGVDSIRTLPTTDWLSQTNQNQHRLPMVSHLLSLPIDAFVQPKTATNESKSLRLPVVDELLSKPIDAFVQSNSNSNSLRLPVVDQLFSMPIKAFTSKENVDEKKPSSLLDNQSVYSKEHWLKSQSTTDDQSDFVHINLDEYIEQSSDKMRRLHFEYIQALDKLKTPIESNGSTQTLQTVYPQMFHRITQHLSSNK